MHNIQTLPFEQITSLIEKITHLEFAKREYFYMKEKAKGKKPLSLLGLLSKHNVNEAKINNAIKWLNNLWRLR